VRHSNTGQYDKAIGQYLNTLKLDPHYKEAFRDLAFTSLPRGNKSEAMELIPQLERLSPGMSHKLQLIVQRQ
jgi:tetratricopeptide (TPR) repeat protein